MKKLISIFVVFALLAAAAFAQDGSWSVGGSGQVGAKLDFRPMQSFQGELEDPPTDNVQWGHATITAGDWDGNQGNLRGNLNINYKAGGLTTGFGINQQDGIALKLSYAGENWNFNAEQNLVKLIGLIKMNVTDLEDTDEDGTDDTASGTLGVRSGERDSLWGNFTFDVLNGIFVEAAISKGSEQWKTTGIFGDTYSHDGKVGKDYLLINATVMDGLEIGLKFPNFFNWTANADFVTDTLQKLVFGAKFSSGPIGVGFQFALLGQGTKYAAEDDKTTLKNITKDDADLNVGLYLGVQYQITDQMKAGLEFRGAFGGQKITTVGGTGADAFNLVITDAVGLQIGASFNFDDGPFGAGVTLKLEDNDAVNNPVKVTFDHNSTFSVAPSVYYNVVPEYLQVKLEFSLTFTERTKLEQTKTDPNEFDYETRVGYSFTPQVYFNFLGTGAGGWDTGIAAKWIIGGTFDQPAPQDTNQLRIVFKWTF